MKKQAFLGLQLLTSFLIIATTDIFAQEDITVGKNVEIVRQHQWLILINGPHSVSIYDSTGQKLNSINLEQRYLLNLSTDNFGNCIANCADTVEFSRIAIYFDNTGKEKWRCDFEYMGGGEGFLLSPDGKYAMSRRHRPSEFKMFATADTSVKFADPYSGLEPDDECCSEFFNDNTINTITRTGTLYLCNPLSGKITLKTELKTPAGAKLYPDIYAGPCMNAKNTLFARAITVKREIEDFEPIRPRWLLVYNKDTISRLDPVVDGPVGLAVIDSQIVISRLESNRNKLKFVTVLYKNNKDHGELIDSSTDSRIGTPVPVGNDIYFYSFSQKRSKKYNSLERKMATGISSIPFFKAKKKGQMKTPKLLISDK